MYIREILDHVRKICWPNALFPTASMSVPSQDTEMLQRDLENVMAAAAGRGGAVDHGSEGALHADVAPEDPAAGAPEVPAVKRLKLGQGLFAGYESLHADEANLVKPVAAAEHEAMSSSTDGAVLLWQAQPHAAGGRHTALEPFQRPQAEIRHQEEVCVLPLPRREEEASCQGCAPLHHEEASREVGIFVSGGHSEDFDSRKRRSKMFKRIDVVISA
jgi:surface antigen